MPSFFVRERAFFTQTKYCQLDDLLLSLQSHVDGGQKLKSAFYAYKVNNA